MIRQTQRQSATQFDGKHKTFDYLELDWDDVRELYVKLGSLWSRNIDPRWSDGSREDLEGYIDNGSYRGLEESVRTSEKILADIDMDSYVQHTVASPVGFAPIVPAYLQGNPANMYAKQREIDNSIQGAIKVYCDIASIASIKGKDMRVRGEAVSAMVMALQAIRPVEVYCCVTTGENYTGINTTLTAIRLGTRPINQARIQAALAEPVLARGFLYDVHQKIGFGNRWDATKGTPRSDSLPPASVPKLLGHGPTDIHLGWMRPSDVAEIKSNAVGWVKKHMEASLRGEGNSYAAGK